jgi:hypothetical protein
MTIFPVVLSELPIPCCHVLTVMSRLSSPDYLIPVVLYQLFCPSGHIFSCAVLVVMFCPILSVLSWLSRHGFAVQLSCTSCPVLAVLFRLSCLGYCLGYSVPALLCPALPSFLSCSGCPSCYVLAVLPVMFWLPCPFLTVPVVLYRLS